MYRARIECQSNSRHVQQLYLGFARLEKSGLLKAQWRYRRDRPSDRSVLRVVLGDGTRLAYDCTDSGRLFESLREDCDFYFKRSLRNEDYSPSSGVLPLGLNYLVYRGPPDLHLCVRALLLRQSGTERIRHIVNSFGLARLLRVHALQHIRLQELQNVPLRPRDRTETRITFFAGLWDPTAVRDAALSEERHEINRMRIACVRALKDNLGANFVGGIIPDSVATRECDTDVLADFHSTRRASYLASLRDCEIGVATHGLQGSVGYKFAEYVACSMAVLTEPFDVKLPGGFLEGRNYLTFTDPASCVELATRLLDDERLRWTMSVNNHRYYLDYVIPERLVLNTLLIASSRDILV